MTDSPRTEAWLRGPVDGIDAYLLPVAHSLIQAKEDADRIASDLRPDWLWARPGGAASIGFHLRHLAGSMDRLFTYARGERLSEAQRAALKAEEQQDGSDTARSLADALGATVDQCLAQLRSTPQEALLTPRPVGRAALPSTTLGLLFHAAEHATRHAGQAITTARILSAQ